MSALIAILALIAAAYFGLRYYRGMDLEKRAVLIRKAVGVLALGVALALLATGRILFAIPFGFFGYFVLWRPQGWFSRTQTFTSSARLASVRTAFLQMTLDQGSGALSGHVLAGTYTGRDLSSLSRTELAQLWRECRAGEPQSRQLLEAYLDRSWPEWRADMPRLGGGMGGGTGPGNGAGQSAPERGRPPMTRAEAFEVLGLANSADLEEIKAAHRNLMKRLHPDQGGTNYLAAKINEAKEVLLGKRA